jgi:hypothetical protein
MCGFFWGGGGGRLMFVFKQNYVKLRILYCKQFLDNRFGIQKDCWF